MAAIYWPSRVCIVTILGWRFTGAVPAIAPHLKLIFCTDHQLPSALHILGSKINCLAQSVEMAVTVAKKNG